MTKVVRFQPDLPNSFIAEQEVSVSRLCSILDAAVLDYEIQSHESEYVVYVSSGLDFPLWVRIEPKARMIRFHTWVAPEQPISAHYDKLNDLNRRAFLAQFHISDSRLYGYYWMTIAGGVDLKHFIIMLREFSTAFAAGTEHFLSDITRKDQYWN